MINTKKDFLQWYEDRGKIEKACDDFQSFIINCQKFISPAQFDNDGNMIFEIKFPRCKYVIIAKFARNTYNNNDFWEVFSIIYV